MAGSGSNCSCSSTMIWWLSFLFLSHGGDVSMGLLLGGFLDRRSPSLAVMKDQEGTEMASVQSLQMSPKDTIGTIVIQARRKSAICG